MIPLRKPPQRSYDPARIELYASEDTLYVQEGNPCLTCHTHPHGRMTTTVAIGVGINTSVGHASLTVDQRGVLTGSVSGTGSNGFVGGLSFSHPLIPGPHVVVCHPSSFHAPSSAGQFAYAQADKTRVGN